MSCCILPELPELVELVETGCNAKWPQISIEIYEQPLNPLPATHTAITDVFVYTTLPYPIGYEHEPEPQVNYYFWIGRQYQKVTQFVTLEKWHRLREMNLIDKFFYLVKRPINEPETEFLK